MIKRLTNLTFFVMLSVAAVAQTTPPASTGQNQPQRRRNQPRPFTLTVNDAAKSKVDTAKLGAAFRNVYPAFATADGYRTKREVTMRIIDTSAKDFTLKATAGEIVASGKWLKKKQNLQNFQQSLQDALHKNWVSVDTIKKDGYSLVFINKNEQFNPTVQKNLINTYFEIYPKLCNLFNKKATHDVIFITDTAYKGVAETSGSRILFSTHYMNQHPYDIDVVTHECTHIVQSYGYSYGRDLVWLTEGIADFMRYKFGVDNVGSKWFLPNFKSTQSYKDSYRVTARFFEWMDQKIKPGMIVQIDEALRNGSFKPTIWADMSGGKSLDELWAAYAADPYLHLVYSSENP